MTTGRATDATPAETTFGALKQIEAGLLEVGSFLDALGIERAIVAGFDWGARTGAIVAALWPERCRALISVSGYLIGSQAAVAAGGGAPVVVSVLLRHRARPRGLRQVPPRLRGQAC